MAVQVLAGLQVVVKQLVVWWHCGNRFAASHHHLHGSPPMRYPMPKGARWRHSRQVLKGETRFTMQFDLIQFRDVRGVATHWQATALPLALAAPPSCKL